MDTNMTHYDFESLPEVTCLQLSYGRPELSQEAVECFARQYYPKKRLIIVNTHHSPVTFSSEFLNKYKVEIFNIKPLRRLSDVYRYGMDLIKTPLFCIWDDDDLFMPWHLNERVEGFLKNKKNYPDKPIRIGHEWCIFCVYNQMEKLDKNMFVAQYLYETSPIRPDEGIAVWDLSWERKFIDEGITIKQDWPYRPSYVYRWGTGESHISSTADEEGQHQNYLRNIEEKGKLNFDFTWQPAWENDYKRMVLELFGSRK